MGENVARECGFVPIVIGTIDKDRTTSFDTVNAAREMLELGVVLILFAGGDGTARDILDAVDDKVPVLGIPAGVKIHSAVYARNPESAGELAAKFLSGDTSIREAEVMDVDEISFREGRVSAKLYGFLKVPFERELIQDVKVASASTFDEQSNMRSIAEHVCEEMSDDYLYVVGPGTTTRAIAERLGLTKTLLGVDVIGRNKLLARDVDEIRLLGLVEGKKSKVIVTPIGGQGYIFGRGNQQISPKVIHQIGKDNIIVVATRKKVEALGGRPLLVDTGDDDADKALTGYIKVIIGYREEAVLKVER